MGRKVQKPDAGVLVVVGVVAITLGLVLAGVRLWASYLVAVNMVTLGLYAIDKNQAQARGGRVPEFVLHLVALAGGTIGALAGQILFRHKTRDTRFLVIFGLIVVCQLIVLAVLL